VTPMHAWLRGLSSDSCGPFSGAWATDVASIDITQIVSVFEQINRDIEDDLPTLGAIAEQRIGEVVGRWRGGVEK